MRTFIILLLTTISFNLFGQNPYLDALKLRKYIVIQPDGTAKFILPVAGDPNEANQKAQMKDYCDLLNKSYYGGSLPTAKQLHFALATSGQPQFNPFLREFLSPATVLSIQNNVPLDRSVTSPGILSRIGGVNVTNIADGIAKFLVERAKQELSIAFFRNFKETLDKPEYRHLRTLFPNTLALLKTIDKDIYRFSAYMQSLREAFIKDLDNIFDTAPQVIMDGALDAAFNASSPAHLKEIFIYALQITKGIKHGTHPGLVIENFSVINPNPAKPALTDMNAIISITKLFSTSLKAASPDSKTYWAPQDSIQLLFSDVITTKIYLGLVYSQAGGIQFSNSASFQSLMQTAVNNISPYIDLIKSCKEKIKDVEEAIDNIKDKKKADVSYNEYYQLFQSVIGILKLDDDIEKLPGLTIVVPQHFKTFVSVAESCNELYLDINLKKYSTGIMRLVTIFDTLLQPAYNNYPANAMATIQLSTYPNFRKYLIKYGTFVASIADAKNSDEVNAAIEAAVLPVGSASIKRETEFNISLNAFIGPFAGSEYLPTLKNNQWAFSYGVTAPVGVAFSWGNKANKQTKKQKEKNKVPGGKSISIFVPLIDVGAMAAFRVGDDGSKVASEVTFSNIISPGLYCYWGFGKCPISLGLGAQVGPQLREVTAKDINVDKNFYVRFGLNLVVDIPFFNFYTKN